MAYDKVTMRQFHETWRWFDRLTALGCAQRDEEYDEGKARAAWKAYQEVFQEQGIEPPPFPK
jgi:hypothetical protein